MSRGTWLAIAALMLGGCRIVSQQELADLKNPPNPHMANITQTWQQKIVPQIAADAKPLDELLKALHAAKDFDTACKTLGYRSQEENPCVFAVSLSGSVTALNTTSRSGKMTLTQADGQAAVVQLGPIIRGTALRDAYKGTSYQDFNDQVLFGDYGRAINNQATAMMQAVKPKTGDRLAVIGVFSSWDIPETAPEITPARVTRQ
ncbi:DUF2291 domain-containing protein [Paramixta manurensis]|uniref:DUF2291 domain-containing protein n=1 Tax=Paramixta manurensis TaxID=2740817 RepID=A0A6M8UHL9_9GAMM|nr:DUF2291 domain-containing protein [Erwiniaceae bacterium PD-1]